MSRQLGEPNKYREAKSLNGFDRRGVSEQDESLRKAKSKRAVVYSQERNPVLMLREIATDPELLALTVYCYGKNLMRGRPSMAQYDGMPLESGSFNNSEFVPLECDLDAIGIAKFIEDQLSYNNLVLANILWRNACPGQGTAARLEALAEFYTGSSNPAEQRGSIKTVGRIVAAEMAKLMFAYFRHRYPNQHDRNEAMEKLSPRARELFSA